MFVNGLVTLRTYERIEYFRNSIIDDLEKSTNVTFSYYAINRWMGIHLDFVCLFFSLCTSSGCLYLRGTVNNEVLAFTLQILTDVLVFFSFSLRMAGEIETFFTSAQRMFKYTLLDQEDDLKKEKDEKLQSWPADGRIEF